MMYIKYSEPDELKLLRQLHMRMNLSTEEQQYYTNLEKGFEGEQKFIAG
jgi:hypothetical protein